MLLGAALNEWSRRTFLGRAVAAVIAIPLSKITAASPPPNPDQDALDLMRWLNTIQVGIESMNHDHKHPEIRNYGSKAEMLGNQEPGLTWQIHTHVDSLLGPKLNPDSPTGEVLPGWTLDFASKPNGYVMALVEKSGASRKVFVTDEHVIIYRTDVAENAIPSLREFKQASEYPGAVGFDRYYSQNQVR